MANVKDDTVSARMERRIARLSQKPARTIRECAAFLDRVFQVFDRKAINGGCPCDDVAFMSCNRCDARAKIVGLVMAVANFEMYGAWEELRGQDGWYEMPEWEAGTWPGRRSWFLAPGLGAGSDREQAVAREELAVFRRTGELSARLMKLRADIAAKRKPRRTRPNVG